MATRIVWSNYRPACRLILLNLDRVVSSTFAHVHYLFTEKQSVIADVFHATIPHCFLTPPVFTEFYRVAAFVGGRACCDVERQRNGSNCVANDVCRSSCIIITLQ